MTLVNSWTQRRPSGSRNLVRSAVVACDGCLPPRGSVGTAADLVARGWRIGDLDHGPHRCPWCARRRGNRGPRLRSRPKGRPALPNFLIIGGVKCGTTSLHSYLDLHPEIKMSEIKELKFFHLPGSLDILDTYALFFDGNAPMRGESSPIYTEYPLVRGVPERIHAAIPDAKLIYLVRDPVERFVSHYCEVYPQQVSIEEALAEPDEPYSRYFVPGRYATQLEQYLSVFSSEQLLVIDQSELLRRRDETLREVFGFLGVDEMFSSPRFESLFNTRATKLSWSRVGTALRTSRLAESIRLLPPRPREVLMKPARVLTTSQIRTPILSEELRERLRDAYRPEVKRLRSITGQDFADWQI